MLSQQLLYLSQLVKEARLINLFHSSVFFKHFKFGCEFVLKRLKHINFGLSEVQRFSTSFSFHYILVSTRKIYSKRQRELFHPPVQISRHPDSSGRWGKLYCLIERWIIFSLLARFSVELIIYIFHFVSRIFCTVLENPISLILNYNLLHFWEISKLDYSTLWIFFFTYQEYCPILIDSIANFY